jgi:hypothetical protein
VTQAFNLLVRLRKCRKDEDGRFHPCRAQSAQDLVTVDVGQHEIENDDVVIVQLADFETVFAKVRGIDHEAFGPQNEFDAFDCGSVILDQ